MRRVLKTFFTNCARGAEYKEEVNYIIMDLLDWHNRALDKDITLLKDREIDVLEHISKFFCDTGNLPSLQLFMESIAEKYDMDIEDAYKSLSLDEVEVLDDDSLSSYVQLFKVDRAKNVGSSEMSLISSNLASMGMNEQVSDRISEISSLLNESSQMSDIVLDLNFEKILEDRANKPIGMSTGIKRIDELIGGLSTATLNTFGGFTSHFKSTWGANIIYQNVYYNGYNCVVMSMETPKEEYILNIMSRHSYDPKFSRYQYIPHDKIRKNLLTDDEKDYLLNVVWKDFQENSRGKLVILDESDFKSYQPSEILQKFEQVDDALISSVDAGIDAFLIDYIQLFKTGDGNDNAVLNKYIALFRRMTQSFRFGKKRKTLTGILLSQINRDGFAKALRNDGRYDVTAFADANGLERDSHRLFTVFTTEEKKVANEASVQILKARNGITMFDPYTTYVNGAAYMFGDDLDGLDQTFGGSSLSDFGSGGGLGDLMGEMDLGF